MYRRVELVLQGCNLLLEFGHSLLGLRAGGSHLLDPGDPVKDAGVLDSQIPGNHHVSREMPGRASTGIDADDRAVR